MKIIRLAFGILLSLFGLMGIFFGVLSIYDPIGAQLADDHNPFATPPNISESIRVTALYVFILLAGILLLFGPAFKRRVILNKSIQRMRKPPC